MTIGTCAWMEHEWLEGLDEATKKLFKIKRYMDDLLIFTAENATWDRDGFEKSIGEECYFPPLSLEDGSEGTFLETGFRITATNRIRHPLAEEHKRARRRAQGVALRAFCELRAVSSKEGGADGDLTKGPGDGKR